jgi:hypothetical protein
MKLGHPRTDDGQPSSDIRGRFAVIRRATSGFAMPRAVARRLKPFSALALATFFGCASSRTASPEPALPAAPLALRIQRIDGPELTLGSLRGRVVLVTVMTTWADLALLEVPRLKKIATSYHPKDLVVVAIALDEHINMVRIFAKTFEIPYYVGTVSDPAQFTGSEGPFGAITIIPTSILVDRDGRMVARMEGLWPNGVLEEGVRRLVAGGSGKH